MSTRDDLMERLARLGAAERLRVLRDEINQIYERFPDLSPGQRRKGTASRGSSSGRRKTPAERAAVSEWMKRYWAQRRGAEKKRR